MDTSKVVVGSRKSELALVQTKHIIKELKLVKPTITCDMITMDTLGDQVLDVALTKIGDKSLFTKSLEIALAEKRVDCLVHSLKDLPTVMIPGMAVGAIHKRDSKFDAVIFHPKHSVCRLGDLPADSVIGTSSLRRIAQLQGQYPGLKFESVRGNLNTRLNKLDSAEKYDALILAEAGIVRMNWQHRIGQILDGDSLYAVGQGALAIEIRSDDNDLARLMSKLSDFNTLVCCVAERAFMNELEGGCSVPIGVSCDYTNDKLSICGIVYSLDGSRFLKESKSTIIENPEACDDVTITKFGVVVKSTWLDAANQADQLGREIAGELRARGADELLREARAVIASSNPTTRVN